MMEERVLKDSLLEANALLVDGYVDGCHDFSSKAKRKIKLLIFREKHPIAYALKNVAAVLISFLLGGAIILGSSERARAAVISWFSEAFDGTFLYRGQYDSDVDIITYSIRDLVSADFSYAEADSYKSEEEICEAYTDSEGYYLYLIAMRPTEGKVAQLLPDEGDEVCQETIGNHAVDHYYTHDGTSNAYVWHDESGTLFYIGGRIGETELNELTLNFMEKYK